MFATLLESGLFSTKTVVCYYGFNKIVYYGHIILFDFWTKYDLPVEDLVFSAGGGFLFGAVAGYAINGNSCGGLGLHDNDFKILTSKQLAYNTQNNTFYLKGVS